MEKDVDNKNTDQEKSLSHAERLETAAILLFLISMGLNLTYNSMAVGAYVGGSQPHPALQWLAIAFFILSIIIGGIANAEKEKEKHHY